MPQNFANLDLTFDWHYIRQKYGGDFAKSIPNKPIGTIFLLKLKWNFVHKMIDKTYYCAFVVEG